MISTNFLSSTEILILLNLVILLTMQLISFSYISFIETSPNIISTILPLILLQFANILCIFTY